MEISIDGDRGTLSVGICDDGKIEIGFHYGDDDLPHFMDVDADDLLLAIKTIQERANG